MDGRTSRAGARPGGCPARIRGSLRTMIDVTCDGLLPALGAFAGHQASRKVETDEVSARASRASQQALTCRPSRAGLTHLAGARAFASGNRTTPLWINKFANCATPLASANDNTAICWPAVAAGQRGQVTSGSEVRKNGLGQVGAQTTTINQVGSNGNAVSQRLPGRGRGRASTCVPARPASSAGAKLGRLASLERKSASSKGEIHNLRARSSSSLAGADQLAKRLAVRMLQKLSPSSQVSRMACALAFVLVAQSFSSALGSPSNQNSSGAPVYADLDSADDFEYLAEPANLSARHQVPSNSGSQNQAPAQVYHWTFVWLVIFMFIGAGGNILVCVAVWRERSLQSGTNYFLLSLAVADLLVCTLVMPFGIIYEFYGHWPYDWQICNLWVTCDVLTCSSSILHMCFISVGRYLGIRNPLHARQANIFVARRAVLRRIALAWVCSTVIASPITMMSLHDHKNIMPNPGECAISNKDFQLFGSLFAFFIPMFVMVPSYVMTVRLLNQRAKFVRNNSLSLTSGQQQQQLHRPSPDKFQASNDSSLRKNTDNCGGEQSTRIEKFIDDDSLDPARVDRAEVVALRRTDGRAPDGAPIPTVRILPIESEQKGSECSSCWRARSAKSIRSTNGQRMPTITLHSGDSSLRKVTTSITCYSSSLGYNAGGTDSGGQVHGRTDDELYPAARQSETAQSDKQASAPSERRGQQQERRKHHRHHRHCHHHHHHEHHHHEHHHHREHHSHHNHQHRHKHHQHHRQHRQHRAHQCAQHESICDHNNNSAACAPAEQAHLELPAARSAEPRRGPARTEAELSDVSSSSACCGAQSSACSLASDTSGRDARSQPEVVEKARATPRPTIMDSAILVAAGPALPATLNHLPVTRNSSSGSSNGTAELADTRNTSNHTTRKQWGRGLRARHIGSTTLQFSSADTSQEPQIIRCLGSSSQVRTEQKALKVLGVVFFTFVVCWTPFFVINFTQAFVDRAQLARWISDELMTIFLWLGYISSTINPIIYTVFNRNFRRAFRNIIMCRSGRDRYSSRSLRFNSINKSFRYSQHAHHRNSSNLAQSQQPTSQMHQQSNGLPSSFKLNLSSGNNGRKNRSSLNISEVKSAGCETMLMLDESNQAPCST